MRLQENAGRMGGRRGACRVLANKLEGKKRLLGKPRRKWENNIKMDLKSVWKVWPGFF